MDMSSLYSLVSFKSNNSPRSLCMHTRVILRLYSLRSSHTEFTNSVRIHCGSVLTHEHRTPLPERTNAESTDMTQNGFKCTRACGMLCNDLQITCKQSDVSYRGLW